MLFKQNFCLRSTIKNGAVIMAVSVNWEEIVLFVWAVTFPISFEYSVLSLILEIQSIQWCTKLYSSLRNP